MPETIFVAGATGQQGSAVINALLSSSFGASATIHGLTRNPFSQAAKNLLSKHPKVRLFAGSFDDVNSILEAAKGCTGAFLNVTPVFDSTGSIDQTGEARHAQNLVHVCSSIPSIKRIVFSSTGAMHSPKLPEIFNEYIPKHPNSWAAAYLTNKKACEDAVASSSFPEGWAIVRGTTFYSNFLKPFTDFMYPDLESKQIIMTASRKDYRVSCVDPNDVGALAARMLISTPEEWTVTWKGKIAPLLSENLTTTEIVGAMNLALAKQGSRKRITLVQMSEEDAAQRANNGDMIADAHKFQSQYFPAIELEEVRSFGIDVDNLVRAEEFFQRESQKLLETVGDTQEGISC